jgi:hypothetical protein
MSRFQSCFLCFPIEKVGGQLDELVCPAAERAVILEQIILNRPKLVIWIPHNVCDNYSSPNRDKVANGDSGAMNSVG